MEKKTVSKEEMGNTIRKSFSMSQAESSSVSTAKQNVLFLKNEMCIFKEKRNVSSGHSFSLSQTLLKSCLRSV